VKDAEFGETGDSAYSVLREKTWRKWDSESFANKKARLGACQRTFQDLGSKYMKISSRKRWKGSHLMLCRIKTRQLRINENDNSLGKAGLANGSANT
jgi:hypothetical protein